MKIISYLVPFCLLAVSTANAQGGSTLASTMDVYVFPEEAQESDQQSKDEAACYDWAVTNSGADPFELTKQSEAQAEQTEQAVAAAQQIPAPKPEKLLTMKQIYDSQGKEYLGLTNPSEEESSARTEILPFRATERRAIVQVGRRTP